MFKFSEKFRINRFRNHYKEFYPVDLDSRGKLFIRNLDSVDLDKPVLIINNSDYMRPSFLYLFLRLGFVDFKFMSAYSLLDIYLGNNEEIKTIMDISPEVLCLYLGYGEFENKRQVDIIIQAVNNQLLLGNKVWVYCKGSESYIESRFPGLIAFFKSNKYNVVGSSFKIKNANDDI